MLDQVQVDKGKVLSPRAFEKGKSEVIKPVDHQGGDNESGLEFFVKGKWNKEG